MLARGSTILLSSYVLPIQSGIGSCFGHASDLVSTYQVSSGRVTFQLPSSRETLGHSTACVGLCDCSRCCCFFLVRATVDVSAHSDVAPWRRSSILTRSWCGIRCWFVNA
ncbi:hypothetical protein EV126DRAFT_15318 [Verticillium dahliae]|nr:hypothetical protein EV126DRAFT_15318 [Verticillium dahliae]